MNNLKGYIINIYIDFHIFLTIELLAENKQINGGWDYIIILPYL